MPKKPGTTVALPPRTIVQTWAARQRLAFRTVAVVRPFHEVPGLFRGTDAVGKSSLPMCLSRQHESCRWALVVTKVPVLSYHPLVDVTCRVVNAALDSLRPYHTSNKTTVETPRDARLA